MNERRRSRRATPAHGVNIMIAGNRSARMVDVTAEGACLELATALNPRGKCRIALPLPNGILRIMAQVVHCKLIGVSGPDSGGGLVYRAGIRFLDVDPRLAASINLAYPAPIIKPKRSGPIKVKVNLNALDHAAETGEHGAN
jgi:hypothetical protein